MSTGRNWLALYTAKILGIQDLDTYFAEGLREELDFVRDDIFGDGGILDPGASLTATSATFVVDADFVAIDGNGKRMAVDASLDAFQDVPFANSGATQYFVGVKSSEVPAAAERGADGSFNFARTEELVGEVVTPDSVIDNGDGTMTLVIAPSGVHTAWGSDTSTRPVRVWLETPESVAEAVYDGTAAYDSGNARIEVTVSHVFGQSSVSTTPADYSILVQGPTIKTTTMAADDDYAQIGTITSGVFSDTTQRTLSSFGDLVTAFAAQHNTSSGVHTNVTAQSYALQSPASGMIATFNADDFEAYGHTLETLTGVPTKVYTAYDETVSPPTLELGVSTTGEARLYIPLRLPGNVTLTHYKISGMRNGAAAAVELRVVREVQGSTAARTAIATCTFADTSGVPLVGAKTALGSPVALTQTDADRLLLELRLKNNGAAANTAAFNSIILYGEYSKLNGGGWADKTS